MLAIFPFFITGAALFSLFSEESERGGDQRRSLLALPPVVGDVIRPRSARTVCRQPQRLAAVDRRSLVGL